MIKGWKHLVIISQDGTTSLKPKADWSKDEDGVALVNDKELNVIFNGVDKNMFRFINICTKSKEAFEIPNTAHEGTSKVRMSILVMKIC